MLAQSNYVITNPEAQSSYSQPQSHLDTIIAMCPHCHATYRVRDIDTLPPDSVSKRTVATNVDNCWIKCTCNSILNAMMKDGNYMSIEERREWSKSYSKLSREQEHKSTMAAIAARSNAAKLPEQFNTREASSSFKKSMALLDPNSKLAKDLAENEKTRLKLEGLGKKIGGSALAQMRARLDGAKSVPKSKDRPLTPAGDPDLIAIMTMPLNDDSPEEIARLTDVKTLHALCDDLSSHFHEAKERVKHADDLLCAIAEIEAAFMEIKNTYRNSASRS
jgi:hypothetical protein